MYKTVADANGGTHVPLKEEEMTKIKAEWKKNEEEHAAEATEKVEEEKQANLAFDLLTKGLSVEQKAAFRKRLAM